MDSLRLHRRFAAWLAMLTMALAALAPAVAQAMVASSERAQWIEVCSTSGMIWLKVDTAETAQPGHSGSDAGLLDASMTCPWCTLHGGMAGLPPVLSSFEHAPRRHTAQVPTGQAQALTAVWAMAHARAPPPAT